MGIAGIYIYFRDERREYTIVTGQVIDMEKNTETHNGHMHINYSPVIEYTFEGETFVTLHRVSSSKYGKGMEIVPASKYKVGDFVDLRVYAENPEYALVRDKNNLLMPLYTGLVMTAISRVMFWIAFKYVINI